jgi:Argininosuccinate synthase
MDSKSDYKKVASHEAHKGEFKKCVLLYSGGLDTSTMLKWIGENYDAEVIALTVDVGQLHENLEAAREKALKLGAKKAIVFDAKKEFAKKIILKMKIGKKFWKMKKIWTKKN